MEDVKVLDDMKVLAEFGRDVAQEPPLTLVRQRNRLLDVIEDGSAAGRRPRRRRPVLAGAAAALVAGAALVVGLSALPGGSSGSPAAAGSPTSGIALAGWSMKVQPDGKVEVHLWDVTNFPALRKAMAQAHVPITELVVPLKPGQAEPAWDVTVPMPDCTPDQVDLKVLAKGTSLDGVENEDSSASGIAFTIDPSALPKDAGITVVSYPDDGVPGSYSVAVNEHFSNTCNPVPVRH